MAKEELIEMNGKVEEVLNPATGKVLARVPEASRSQVDAAVKAADAAFDGWARTAPNTFPALAKTTANYANSGLIKMEAVAEGYAEGIALDIFQSCPVAGSSARVVAATRPPASARLRSASASRRRTSTSTLACSRIACVNTSTRSRRAAWQCSTR
mgnify:CR=1 FL=1